MRVGLRANWQRADGPAVSMAPRKTGVRSVGDINTIADFSADNECRGT